MVLKVLNVAEKNDAAKEISRVLSRGQTSRREGYSKFNKIYEFKSTLFNTQCQMVMTSVSGHLLDVEFSGIYKNWKNCSPICLFDAPLMLFCPEKFKDIKKTLEREAKQCQKLIIWTDGDREGENIGFEIIDVCQKANSRLQVFRARFSEITEQSVSTACSNLIVPDELVSNAVEARRELDLRIGAAFTRFQTLRFQRRFPEVLEGQLISYGSCQFPTLGFVVERFKQVQNFISEKFYKIKVLHSKDDCHAEFNWKRGRLFQQRARDVFYNICIQDPTAHVVKVLSKPKHKWRPFPLDTVELEKLASRKLKISAKETMKIAEKLYTSGFISYPRTETNMFPKDFHLQSLVELQVNDSQWGAFAQRVLQNGPCPRKGKKTDNAHPPIHPTKYSCNLQGNEKRVYELVTRHFLACCDKDAEGNETTVNISINNEEFSTSGLIILERNYLDVYPYDRWSGRVIPHYNEGDQFQPTSIERLDGDTSAPPLLTEADLIALMDKHGIGTDATHAEHIETIKTRAYVAMQQDLSFVPGELGIGLVDGYDAMGFNMSKPFLRSNLESDLKDICNGIKSKEDVLRIQIAKYKHVFEEACRQIDKLDTSLAHYFGQPVGSDNADQDILNNGTDANAPLPVVRKCPKCKTMDMLLRKTKENSWMIGCSGFPECRTSIFLPKFITLVEIQDETCSKCSSLPANKVYKLKLISNPRSAPPSLPQRYIGCIGGCDDLIHNLLGIDISHHQSSSNARNQSASANNRNANRSNKPTSDTRQKQQKRSLQLQQRPAAGNTVQPVTNSASGNDVICQCQKTAILLTVRKDGPNCGRQFFKCSERDNGCNFFLWADDTQNQQPDRQANVPGPSRSFQSTNDDNEKCQCGQPAVTRKVSKEGPNQGRPFLCCQFQQPKSCGFFQWADEDAPLRRNASKPQNQSKGKTGQAKTGTKRRQCSICRQEGHTKKTCPSQK